MVRLLALLGCLSPEPASADEVAWPCTATCDEVREAYADFTGECGIDLEASSLPCDDGNVARAACQLECLEAAGCRQAGAHPTTLSLYTEYYWCSNSCPSAQVASSKALD